MRIVKDFPPNYDDICIVFRVRDRKGVVFTYGDTIFSPDSLDLPRELVIHEQVHSDQQAKEPEAWWLKYLDDDDFRLNQEVEAYRKQYDACADYPRALRRRILRRLAADLASPMYGCIISEAQAERLIKNATGSD